MAILFVGSRGSRSDLIFDHKHISARLNQLKMIQAPTEYWITYHLEPFH